jgi:hypothetical protein
MPTRVTSIGARRRAAVVAALLAAVLVAGCTQTGGATPAPAAPVMTDDDGDPNY